MPGRRCAVFGCNNSRSAARKKGQNTVFHSFPKGEDLESKTVQKAWIHCCKRADTFNTGTSSICCVHFTDDDYERDLRNELLGLPPRKLLKKTAIPTLNLHTKLQWQSESTLQQKQLDGSPGLPDGRSKEEVIAIEETISSQNVETLHQSLELSSQNQQHFESDQSVPYEMKYTDLLEKYNQLSENYSRLQETCRKKNKKMKALSDQLRYYKNKSSSHQKQSRKRTDIAENLLKMVLTENQISILSKRKKKS